MHVEIVTIGDELLLGMVVNTNAAFVSRALSEAGWSVARHTTLPDDPEALERGLHEALERSPLVIATGGLGPTCDDLTRVAAACLFHSPFHESPLVAQDLERRFGTQLASLKDQARVPSKAHLFLNAVGTAPGLAFNEGGKILILMPGVPREMEPMCRTQVIPYLKQVAAPPQRLFHHLHHLCLLSENAVDPFLRELKAAHPEVDVGIYPSHGTLTVRLSGEAEPLLHRLGEQLRCAFPHHLFQAKTGKIEEAVHEALLARNKSLILAESCTGGLIAEKLTALPGASEYFLGSVVAYSNALKRTLLRVSDDTLRTQGAVSRLAVEEMVAGLFHISDADYALAVSGIAGPTGGTPDKPVGTVWAALGVRGQPIESALFSLKGNRQTIIAASATRLLGHLWRKVVHGESLG